MSFFSIISAEEIDYGSSPMNLKVIQGTGVEVIPDLNINVNSLNNGNKYFLNNGYGGITFKIDVIINKNDIFTTYRSESIPLTFSITNGVGSYLGGGVQISQIRTSVIDKLHEWITTMTPVYVVTDAIDIPNGRYIISKNSSRKQTYRENTVWTLEFTEFKGINITKYKNDNKYVDKAKKNYAKAKAKAKKAQSKKAKANNANKNKLKKCKLANLKYGLKKSNCVKYMQTVLYKKGYLTKKQVDGWFGTITKNALKKFQKKYQKKYKLKINGKVDKATLKALINV